MPSPAKGEKAKLQRKIDSLVARERRLAMGAKERKRCALDLKFEEYESAIELAETFEEPLAVVLRACFRMGLEHYQQWATKANGTSPFLDGSWRPRTPSQIDPTGTARRAPALQEEPFEPVRGRTIAAPNPPPKREQYVDTSDAVFMPEVKIDAAALPNGYTDESRSGSKRRKQDDDVEIPIPSKPAAVVEQGDDIVIAPTKAAVEDAARERVRSNDRANAARTRTRRQKQKPAPTEDENIFNEAAEPSEQAHTAAQPSVQLTTLEQVQAAQEADDEGDPNDFL